MAVADESSRKYLDLLESGSSLIGYGLKETLCDIEYTGLKKRHYVPAVWSGNRYADMGVYGRRRLSVPETEKICWIPA